MEQKGKIQDMNLFSYVKVFLRNQASKFVTVFVTRPPTLRSVSLMEAIVVWETSKSGIATFAPANLTVSDKKSNISPVVSDFLLSVTVDDEKLAADMDKFQVETADFNQVAIMTKEPVPSITVEETYSAKICAVLCLELETSVAWKFNQNMDQCQCFDIQEEFCQEDIVLPNTNETNGLQSATTFNLKMASAPIRSNCTNRVLIIGGQHNKDIDGNVQTEVLDLDDPEVDCQYIGEEQLPIPIYGLVGGQMSFGMPLFCGGIASTGSNNKLAVYIDLFDIDIVSH